MESLTGGPVVVVAVVGVELLDVDDALSSSSSSSLLLLVSKSKFFSSLSDNSSSSSSDNSSSSLSMSSLPSLSTASDAPPRGIDCNIEFHPRDLRNICDDVDVVGEDCDDDLKRIVVDGMRGDDAASTTTTMNSSDTARPIIGVTIDGIGFIIIY